MGQYLRSLREERGLTVRELARAVGLPESSASYISQLEAGLKVPNTELAMQLARTLQDRLGIFRLWSLTARRGDPQSSSVALRELARLLGDPSIANDPHFVHPSRARIESARESLFEERRTRIIPDPPDIHAFPAQSSMEAEPEPRALSRLEERMLARRVARSEEPRSAFRVPLIPEGTDPDRGEWFGFDNPLAHREFMRIDHTALQAMALREPFAYRLTERSLGRVSSILQPGDVVVLTREVLPIVENEVYAVRHEGRIELSLVMWNGAQLLLLPAQGRSDFIVLEARDERRLSKHLAGRVATAIRGGG